jgi:hypothetical protein
VDALETTQPPDWLAVGLLPPVLGQAGVELAEPLAELLHGTGPWSPGISIATAIVFLCASMPT